MVPGQLTFIFLLPMHHAESYRLKLKSFPTARTRDRNPYIPFLNLLPQKIESHTKEHDNEAVGEVVVQSEKEQGDQDGAYACFIYIYIYRDARRAV